MGGLSIWHWLIVLVVVVLIFGTKKLRNIGQDLGGAVKGFKEGMKTAEDDGRRGQGGRDGARSRSPARRSRPRSRRTRWPDVRRLTRPRARRARPTAHAGPEARPRMFDIGFSEIMVIAVVALVVLGPEKLPKTARTLGHLFGRLQRYVSDVKADINREIELDELRKLQRQVQKAAREIETSMTSAQQEIESNVRALESELNAAGTGEPADAATAPAAAGRRPADAAATPPAAQPPRRPDAAEPRTAAAGAAARLRATLTRVAEAPR